MQGGIQLGRLNTGRPDALRTGLVCVVLFLLSSPPPTFFCTQSKTAVREGASTAIIHYKSVFFCVAFLSARHDNETVGKGVRRGTSSTCRRPQGSGWRNGTVRMRSRPLTGWCRVGELCKVL